MDLIQMIKAINAAISLEEAKAAADAWDGTAPSSLRTAASRVGGER